MLHKKRSCFFTVNGSFKKHCSNKLWGLICYQLLVKNMTTGDSKHPQLQQHNSLKTENKSPPTSHTDLHLNHQVTKNLFMWYYFHRKEKKSNLNYLWIVQLFWFFTKKKSKSHWFTKVAIIYFFKSFYYVSMGAYFCFWMTWLTFLDVSWEYFSILKPKTRRCETFCHLKTTKILKPIWTKERNGGKGDRTPVLTRIVHSEILKDKMLRY